MKTKLLIEENFTVIHSQRSKLQTGRHSRHTILDIIWLMQSPVSYFLNEKFLHNIFNLLYNSLTCYKRIHLLLDLTCSIMFICMQVCRFVYMRLSRGQRAIIMVPQTLPGLVLTKQIRLADGEPQWSICLYLSNAKIINTPPRLVFWDGFSGIKFRFLQALYQMIYPQTLQQYFNGWTEFYCENKR